MTTFNQDLTIFDLRFGFFRHGIYTDCTDFLDLLFMDYDLKFLNCLAGWKKCTAALSGVSAGQAGHL